MNYNKCNVIFVFRYGYRVVLLFLFIVIYIPSREQFKSDQKKITIY